VIRHGLTSRWSRGLLVAAGLVLGATACGGGNGQAALSGSQSEQGQQAPGTSGSVGGSVGGTQAQPAAPQAPGQSQPGAPQVGTQVQPGAAQAPGAAQPVGSAGAVASSGHQVAPAAGVPKPGGAPGALGATDVGVTATTITLGTVNLASATRSLGPVIAEVTAKTDQATIDWINVHGGINGRKLQLLVCDDGGDSARGMACYEKLKSQVFAFIPGETLLTETVHTAVERDHVPYLSWGWFVNEFHSPYMFPCHANGINEATASANWVIENLKDVKTVGINYLNVSEDIAAKDAAKNIFEQHGVKVVQAIPQEWDSPDESQHVLSQRVANPDIIMIYGWPSSTAKFFHDANGQNWAPRHGYIGNHLTFDPGYGKIYGEYIKDKVIGITSYVYPPDVTPGNTLWRQVSNQYAGRDLVGLHFKYSMGHHITQASFNCVMVAAKLLGMMGANPTRAQFVDLLESNQIDTGDGIVLRWPHGNHLQDPYAFNREFMYKWITQSDGSFDEARVLPDAFFKKEVDMCQLPKVEDCRAMQPTGTILTGADRFYK